MIDVGLYLAYALVLLALVLAIGFPLIYMIRHPQEAKFTLLGVLTVVVVFVLAYAFSSSELYFNGIEKYNLSPSEIKLIGAGLNTFFVLGAIAVIAAIYAEVSTLFK